MTTTVAPDIETLEDLDWTPACQSDYCSTGHPTATHVVIYLMCSCPPLPICTVCADRVRKNIAELTTRTEWKCWVDGTTRRCTLAEMIKVEPLPGGKP